MSCFMNERTGRSFKGLRVRGSLSWEMAVQGLGLSLEPLLSLAVSCLSADKTPGTRRLGTRDRLTSSKRDLFLGWDPLTLQVDGASYDLHGLGSRLLPWSTGPAGREQRAGELSQQ